MKVPLEFAARDMEIQDALRDLVEDRVAQLERLYGGITSCRVHVSAPHNRHRRGNLFEVTLEVHVPGRDLVTKVHKHDAPEHEHLAVAVRDAFSAMERKLRAWKQKARGDVKHHDGPLQGRIAEIHHDEGYGQIIATDHRLIYFHRNSVVDGSFDALRPRDPVELVVQTDESDIGPQASTVRPIGGLDFDPG
ncbi:ribosome hibernation-promoting factor, HPF/YfiA family [Roseovarius salis]|uniref:ribosome hibernation-promoting factor, HPF/YfiA family n=1 Tax=Roseovarius salis TaxID=3376063 RepID=UPI0037CAEEDF